MTFWRGGVVSLDRPVEDRWLLICIGDKSLKEHIYINIRGPSMRMYHASLQVLMMNAVMMRSSGDVILTCYSIRQGLAGI
jgi:hypothetical protein